MIVLTALALSCFQPILHYEPTDYPQYGGPGRSFTVSMPATLSDGEPVLWKRPLGPGTSGVVADDARIYTIYSIPTDKNPAEGVDVVVAMDRLTGKTQWEHRDQVARLKGQESCSGDPIRPQSTPLLTGGTLVTVGYTGLVRCFESSSGKLLWQTNLVEEHGATPVQFGFSSSPLLVNGKLILHTGGRASLKAFSPRDGKPIWSSEAGEPSYSSPVVTQLGAERVVVQTTQDAVLWISVKDGSTIRRYPMPKPGLTNVSTSLPLPDGKLLISGQ